MEITELDYLDPDRVDGVSSPANGVPFLVIKSLDDHAEKFVSAADRRKMARSGVAMPDGAFPIPDEGHLRSAIGRLAQYKGNTAAAKRHIIERARSLGLVHLLPKEWNVSDHKKAAPSQSAAEARALTPPPARAAGQTREMHPDAGPKRGDNSQPGGWEMPQESGFGDPEDDAEGFGDTAPDKGIPMAQASSQTEAMHKAGAQDGRGDIAGERGEEDFDEAEDMEPDDKHGPTARTGGDTPGAQASMKAGRGDPDGDPGSPAWEHKDVALGEKAEDLVNQLADVVRTFTQREKAETGSAKKEGRRHSGKTEATIRRCIQILQDLLDGTDSQATKETIDMTTDELIKLLDERDARRVTAGAKKAKAKKAKAKKASAKEAKAKKAKKATETNEVPPTADVDAIAKSVGAVLDGALKDAVTPLAERIASMEARPARTGAMTNAAGLSGQPLSVAVRGGEQVASAMKDLQARFDAETNPEAKAKLGNELTKARLVAFENMRVTGFAGV